jgi:hypothetical protein
MPINKQSFLNAIKTGAGVGAAVVGSHVLKNALAPVAKALPVKTLDLSWQRIAAEEALRKAKGPGMLAKAAAIKVGTMAGLGLVGAAGAAGAYAISRAKKGFDKDKDAQVRSEMAAEDMKMKLIKSKRKTN